MSASLVRSLTATALMALLAGGCKDSPTTDTPECSVSGVAVAPPAGPIEIGGTATLTATITQEHCSGLVTTWSSSNESIATVSAAGVVTGVTAGGPVTITASAGGKMGTTAVTITAVAVASITIDAPYGFLPVGLSETVTPVIKGAHGAVLTGRTVTWSTTNSSGVSVTQGGVIQGMALGGPVTITATVEGHQATLGFTVVPRFAYVTADRPTQSAAYDADNANSYSPIAANTTITRTAIGTYSVNFPAMAAGSRPVVAMAQAFGQGNALCSADDQADAGTALVVTVVCRDPSGAAIDQTFVATIMGSDAFAGRFGFAWANQPSAATAYTPPAARSYNAAGQAIQVSRASVGNYSVTFTGNGRASPSNPAETFLVMPTGGGAVRCAVYIWSETAAMAVVHCTNQLGTLTDAPFVITMLEAGRSAQRHALAWIDCASVCSVDPGYARSTGGTITVTRTSAGRYDVLFPGLGHTTGGDNVLVSGYRQDGSFCKASAVATVGSDLKVSVLCFSPGSSVADEMFTIAVIH